MLDRILIFAPLRPLGGESLLALRGLGAEVLAVERWEALEEELRLHGAVLVLILSPLRGRPLAERVAALRALVPRLQIFHLWWDYSEQGAVERLLAGVNQIYTLPCAVERLRLRVARVLQERRGKA